MDVAKRLNKIVVATIQPPVPEGKSGRLRSAQRGLELAGQAAEAGARIICLPEFFGVFGLPPREWRRAISCANAVLKECAGLARRRRVAVLCPSLESEDGRLYNTTWVIAPDGKVAGKYRKVHLTLSERKDKKLTPGDAFPVFSLCGVTFGVMTCYDAYFPESARILALQGAQVIFWPSLQRAATEEVISLQVRSRAFDNCVYVVRASYGHPKTVAWTPGMMAGMSCVVDCEGRIVADLGHDEGFLAVEIAAGGPRPRRRFFEGEPESPRKFLFEDRRPRLYRQLCED